MENDVLYNRIMKKVAEMIAEAGGGSSLPEVTADDNGDVLTVVSGAWAKAEPAKDIVFVPYIDDGASYTTTLTAGEIFTILNSGKYVLLTCIAPDISFGHFMIPVEYRIEEGNYRLILSDGLELGATNDTDPLIFIYD